MKTNSNNKEEFMGHNLTKKHNGYEGYYSDYVGNISHEMLNEAYGDKGRTFTSLHTAKAFSARNPGSKIYTIRDYIHTDILRCVPPKPREGAVPYIKAYLVSLQD